MAATEFMVLCDKFRLFHSNPANIGLHLVTTPLAVAMALSAVNKLCSGSSLVVSLNAAYLLSMATSMPPIIFTATAISMCCIVYVAHSTFRWSWAVHTLLFCVGYFGQDLSHYMTSEPTFQSSYQQESDFWNQVGHEACR